MNILSAKACLVMNSLVGETPFCPTPVSEGVKARFLEHIAQHGLNFATVEEFNYRLGLFQALDEELERINADETNTFEVGHNFFSTMTEYEKKMWRGYEPDEERFEQNVVTLPEDNLAVGIDWRAKGKVNFIKSQGMCASCWAFATISTMESSLAINTNVLKQLSEQQMVDCPDNSRGC